MPSNPNKQTKMMPINLSSRISSHELSFGSWTPGILSLIPSIPFSTTILPRYT